MEIEPMAAGLYFPYYSSRYAGGASESNEFFNVDKHRAATKIGDKMRYLICLMMCLGPLTSNATTVVSLTVEKMAQEADAIVRGVVTKRTSNWNKARNRIYTVTALQVGDVLKGTVKSTDTLNIRQIGGEVDGIGQMIVGNAKFSVGEEVLVFLEKHPTDAVYVVMGMAQGKYSIDRNTTPPSVRRSMGQLNRVSVPKPGNVVQLKSPPMATTLPSLNVLLGRIRSALVPQ